MHKDYLVSDCTFNSVEGIAIAMYCVLVNGNDVCRTYYIIYSK